MPRHGAASAATRVHTRQRRQSGRRGHLQRGRGCPAPAPSDQQSGQGLADPNHDQGRLADQSRPGQEHPHLVHERGRLEDGPEAAGWATRIWDRSWTPDRRFGKLVPQPQAQWRQVGAWPRASTATTSSYPPTRSSCCAKCVRLIVRVHRGDHPSSGGGRQDQRVPTAAGGNQTKHDRIACMNTTKRATPLFANSPMCLLIT